MTLAELEQQLVALRLAGAQQFDPVRFAYMEALARRAQGQNDKVQALLKNRLAGAFADWSARHHAQVPTQAPTQVPTQASAPDAAPRPLAALLHYLAQQSPGSAERQDSARPELHSVRKFRNTWSKLSSDKQVKKSLAQAPKNAGPLNSHMLVLRSLGLMRDISPDYLNRFMCYADTLLCLELRETEPVRASTGASKSGTASTGRPRRKLAASPAPGTPEA